MSSTLESGLKTYDWATDSTQSFVTGMNDNSAILDKSIKWNDQVKREFYKQMCKDVTSDGSDVTVGNGMNGYVLSGEVKGQTVKNLCPTVTISNMNINNQSVTVQNMIITINSNNLDCDITHKNDFQPNKQYVLKYWVYSNSLTEKFGLNIGTSPTSVFPTNVDIPIGFIGTKEVVVTTKTDLSLSTRLVRTFVPATQTGSISYSVAIFDVGSKTSDSPIPFGLSSTTASITNNGITYPFYANATDATNKKPILLGGVGGVYDTLTVNEDGSGVLVQNTLQIILNGSENWFSFVENTNTCTMSLSNSIIGGSFNGSGMCDKMPFIPSDSSDTEHCRLSGSSSPTGIMMWITKSKLSTIDVVGFKTWLQSNPITVRYQLATPITTQIPKELMPVVLTQLSNQFKVGDAVKSSSYTLKVPTSDGVKSESLLTLLNGYVAVANSLTPVCRLTKDNRVEITLDCTSPSTFNATVTSIPLNMRPLKDVRIIGFVDGVATPVTIKTTGEVQLPNSIVSKNVYVKDTYRLNAN